MESAIHWRGDTTGSLDATCRLARGKSASAIDAPAVLRCELNVEG